MSAFDIAAARRRLADQRGPAYWKGLEELAGDPGFESFLHEEFPGLARLWQQPVDRRSLLKLMGASLALAGLTACGRMPGAKLVPYVNRPEAVTPGDALYFATALSPGGYAEGVLVESHTGRPTFIEGNPAHPASLGAVDPKLQAMVLELYDPDRSQSLIAEGQIASDKALRAMLGEVRGALRARRGEGLRILTPAITSPSLAAQLQRLLNRYPRAVWHQHDPVDRSAVYDGAELAFGEPLETRYDLARAQVILSLDADLFGTQPGHLRYAHDFAAGRRVRDETQRMNRLYVVESTPTLTGASADHRLPLAASRIEALARALARRLGLAVAAGELPVPAPWLEALARDLERHGAEAVVIAGDEQPAAVHALIQAINAQLGNFGSAVLHSEPVAAQGAAPLASLISAIDANQVDVLLILESNPVYDAPADLAFAERLAQVPLTLHAGLYRNETARQCQWHINTAHPLESWGDARAYDGTVSLVQPLIAPLYDGRTLSEVLALLEGPKPQPALEQLRSDWQARHPGSDFESFWEQSLREGVVARSAAAVKRPRLQADWAATLGAPKPGPAGGLELQFRPDLWLWDGRFANNGWLQELPRPLSKLTWDNALLVAPTTAERLGLTSGDLVELRHAGHQLVAAVWVMPGQPNTALNLALGYGRSHAGQLGNGVGFDAYRLRSSDSPWLLRQVTITKTGKRYPLVTTQVHHSMEGRDFVRSASLSEFRRHPHFAQPDKPEPPPSLYPPYQYNGYRWGMVIDLTACIGCSACVSACQAENNTAIVGKAQMARGHDMHWLRVDRYYHGGIDEPTTYFEPVPCMQCENAPCEYVCPVGATLHDGEGLNEMIFNRCIGTRFCSQNCPYKVRRFNWFNYMGPRSPTPEAVNNPDVTVRQRGVMEKCTYCIQRIAAARIRAGRENRTLRAGEVKTACQAACPTRAIVFGDLNNRDSSVSRLSKSPLNYGLLVELNTRPRTTYLARISNPNPEIGQA